jgi:hypothetical protein
VKRIFVLRTAKTRGSRACAARRVFAVLLGALLLAGAVRAGDGGSAGAAVELVAKDYEAFKFSLSVPAAWSETAQPNGVKWEVEGKAAACEVTYFQVRRDLADVEKKLRGKAAANNWKFVAEPTHPKIDGCPAFYMLVDTPVPDAPDEGPVRQLFVVIDAPGATYLLTYGDLMNDFDRDTIERVANSFKRKGAAPPPPTPPTASNPPDAGQPPAGEVAWGCPACNKPYPQNFKFCGDCGGKCGPLAPAKPKTVTVFGCAACKKEWPAGTKFCGDCGAKNGNFEMEAPPEKK